MTPKHGMGIVGVVAITKESPTLRAESYKRKSEEEIIILRKIENKSKLSTNMLGFLFALKIKQELDKNKNNIKSRNNVLYMF